MTEQTDPASQMVRRVATGSATARDRSIVTIATRSGDKTGFPFLELIPIIEAAIQVLSACEGSAETPEQFVAAHTNADGTFSKQAVNRLRFHIRVEAAKHGREMTPREAETVAVEMFREGTMHGENVGAVMRGE